MKKQQKACVDRLAADSAKSAKSAQSRRRHANSLRASVACLLGALAMPVQADIFVSQQDGSAPRFTNRPLDGSYEVFIRDQTPGERPAASVPGTPARSGRRLALEPLIERAADRHAVDAALIRAVIEVESRFNVNAVSRAGAVGAMQLMPATARRYGVGDRLNPGHNVEAGVAHLKELLTHFGGNVALALAAYNAGQPAVARHRNVIPPYRETMLYVPQVLAAYARYRDEDGRTAR